MDIIKGMISIKPHINLFGQRGIRMKILGIIATFMFLAQASGASGYSAKDIMARNKDKLVTVLSLNSKGAAIAAGSTGCLEVRGGAAREERL